MGQIRVGYVRIGARARARVGLGLEPRLASIRIATTESKLVLDILQFADVPLPLPLT